jgi:ABC-2 type transport system permease protein
VSTIGTIARKEFRELTRDGRFRWAAAIVLTLASASSLAGSHQYASSRSQRVMMERQERERWLNKADMHPHAAAHDGLYVVRPLMPLSSLDGGLTQYTGLINHLEAEEQKLFQFKPAQDGTPVQRIAELTTAATFQHVVPLLIIVLLFPLFAGEREQGTLRYVLSLGVSRRHFVWGKTLGTVVPVLVVPIVATLISVSALALSSGPTELRATLPRAAVFIGAHVFYFAIFIGLSIAVSARARSPRQALAVLLSVWFVNALAASPLVMNAIGLARPEPNGFEFRAAVLADQRARFDLGPDEIRRRREKLAGEVRRRHGLDDAIRISPEGAGLLFAEAWGTELFEKRIALLHDAYEQQNRVYRLGAFVAPLIGLQSLSMAMAGTDYAHVRHFADAAERYRRQLMQIMNDDIALNDFPENRAWTGRSDGERQYIAGKALWARVPAFEYEQPDTRWAMRGQGPALGGLLLWAAVIAVVLPLTVVTLPVD